mmetsp:Transcript_12348/g.18557  ORF Transcript_12348/g.18557 Transcript_12348/m.18557 type:complete len:99 (+) Transcript_12348:64-360(+)
MLLGWALTGACGMNTGNKIRLDGSLLGDSDGLKLGTFDGPILKVGMLDGITDGFDEGDKLGTTDGISDGPAEGITDGFVDGLSEGQFDGTMDATSVGS